MSGWRPFGNVIVDDAKAVTGHVNGDTGMSKLTALTTFMFLVVSSAWAQTPAPAPGGTSGSPPAGDAGATGGGIMDYWWMILLAVIIIAGIWYFSRGRSRT